MLLALFAFLTKMFHLILGIAPAQKFPPPLSAEEESALFAAMEGGDDAAREKLILHNLRLVSHIVRKYYSTAKDAEDLVSIGTVGLIKAVDSFNLRNGAKFATYAAKCIQNEILMHFRAQKKRISDVSIHEMIDVDRDGNPLTYLDVLCGDEDIAEEIDRKISTERMMQAIDRLLTARERQIIRMRYGLGIPSPLTQREIATALGISRSYVSRIEKSALSKLKSALS